ncbi:MAG: helix-turn-helix domain-containing protein [Bacteroidaceae bacterium]|nr:helix-turn-helix domain-containing protein [Bacteroidaceae bacterium]
MKEINRKADPKHPYIRKLDAIKEREVVVIDNIKAPPLVGLAYIADNCLIIVSQQGSIINSHNEEYALRPHDISILLPDHFAMPERVTPDFVATNVALSRSFFEELRLRYPYTRYASLFRQRPPCHLTEEQFVSARKLVDTIRDVSEGDSPHRREMLLQLLCVLLNLLGEYHVANYPDEKAGKESLFSTFYENITLHYRESRELAYYAHLLNVTPKRLSAVILAETGIRAMQWITHYIVVQAKMLLDSRRDMSVQQISFYLGFSEQAAFCRYFKANTGLSPIAYRNTGKASSD